VREVCELHRVKTVNGHRCVNRKKVDVTWNTTGKEVIASTFRLDPAVMAMWHAVCPGDALDTNTLGWIMKICLMAKEWTGGIIDRDVGKNIGEASSDIQSVFFLLHNHIINI
jgi:hypothetical protein